MAVRRLIVNADDFGFTCDVNAGIIRAHREGILTATTLMANGTAFDDAVRLAGENAGLDVGCHLVLVQGESLDRPGRDLPVNVAGLMRAVALKRLDVYAEMRAQIKRICAAGIRPTHLDTHKHTHLLPPVLDAAARLAREFGIPWLRQPFDFKTQGAPGRRLLAALIGLNRARFRRVIRRYGLRGTDHFAGFSITGRFGPRELASLLRRLPPGATELMCHPGLYTPELDSARTRLKQSRQDELDALTSPEVRAALEESCVELACFRDLA
jgi:chitin disaccharide deacetylase